MDSQPSAPLFSVVIPTYNRSDQIRETLQSVQGQTLQDFECIIIDDGSQDATALAAVVSKLDDDRFVYVRQENSGASSARNRGFDLARGKYVALLDSDDQFVPEKLEKVAEVMNRFESDVLVYSQMIVERGLEKKWIRPSRGPAEGERVDEYLLCAGGTIRTSTVALPVSVARSVRFNETLPSLQDTDFAIRVANAGVRIEFIQEPLVVFDDKVGASRISRNSNYKPLLEWLDSMRRKQVSERAYWAGRGGHCARIASYSNRTAAIRLYAQAVAHGAFSWRRAVVIAAQVIVPYRAYQTVANGVVKILGRPAAQ
ncbi:glycosyltransferase family 2 protein [Mycobacterium sp. 4D054]|uniref:glycosyltransferase family 2 protein n=1 Tax=Mycobacterium sp. 4D054 TaxID=3457440 RepID=UPI003FD4FE69